MGREGGGAVPAEAACTDSDHEGSECGSDFEEEEEAEYDEELFQGLSRLNRKSNAHHSIDLAAQSRKCCNALHIAAQLHQLLING